MGREGRVLGGAGGYRVGVGAAGRPVPGSLTVLFSRSLRVLPPPAGRTKLAVRMATRVRTAAVWVSRGFFSRF